MYHIALWSLAIAVVLSVLGGVLLNYNDKEAPEWLSALGATAIGAIAGLIQGR